MTLAILVPFYVPRIPKHEDEQTQGAGLLMCIPLSWLSLETKKIETERPCIKVVLIQVTSISKRNLSKPCLCCQF